LRERDLFHAAGLDRLATARVRSPRDAALAAVLISIGVAAEILDGVRKAPGELPGNGGTSEQEGVKVAETD
jgi:hypothetical protein